MSAALLAAATTFAVVASSNARVGDRPIITGDPIVGETLTASGGDVYHWQRCDPSVATCVDADANDPNWTSTSNNTDTYALSSADLGMFIRVIGKGTNLGTQFVSSEPVGPVLARTESGQAAALPQHGISFLAEPVGNVEYKPAGQKGLRPLSDARLLFVGSIFDTRDGRVKITAAKGNFGDQIPDQTFDYYLGVFKFIQKAATNSDGKAKISGKALSKLFGKLSCSGGASSSSASAASGEPKAFTTRRRRRRRLWGSGSGSYSTSGGGGTGSVRGTTFRAIEKCGGTQFFLPGGQHPGAQVDVFDKNKKKTIELGPGDKYFAQRP